MKLLTASQRPDPSIKSLWRSPRGVIPGAVNPPVVPDTLMLRLNPGGLNNDISYLSDDKFARRVTFQGTARLSNSQLTNGTASFRFASNADRISLPGDATLSFFNTPLTLDLDLRFTSFSNGFKYIFSVGSPTPSSASLYLAFDSYSNGTRDIVLDFTNSAGQFQRFKHASPIISTLIGLNTWRRIRIVVPSGSFGVTNAVYLYIDGIYMPLSRDVYTSGVDPLQIAAGIGEGTVSFGPGAIAGGATWAGFIDNVAFYREALSGQANYGHNLGLASPDPFFETVALLLRGDGSLNDSSANSLAGTVTMGNPTTAVPAKHGTGAIDVTGGTITYPFVAANDLNDLDFTIEFWLWIGGAIAGEHRLLASAASDPTNTLAVGTRPNPRRIGLVAEGVNWMVEIAWTPAIGQWQHIAFSRRGSTNRVFVDGLIIGTVTNQHNWNTAGSGYRLFGGLASPARYDDLRITRGVSRYNANFTPPGPLPSGPSLAGAASPTPEPDFDAVSLLLPLSSDLQDYGPKGFSVRAVGSAVVSDGSLQLPGAGSYLQVGADQAFSFGSGSFTLECWVSFAALPASGTTGALLGKWADGNGTLGEFFWYYNGSRLGLDFRGVGVGYQSVQSAVVAMPLNTWVYAAVTRNGATWTFNVNGQISTATNSAAIKTETDALEIGGIISPAVNQSTQCRLRDMRITKGLARAIDSIPTAAFPAAWTQADSANDRLVGWWDFDESDGNALDKAGRYPLTLSGYAGPVAGVVGTARSTDGSNSNYFFSNEWVFRGSTQPLYIALRVRFNSFVGDPSFCGRYAFDTNDRSWMFQVNSAGTLVWIVSRNGLSGAGNAGVASWGTTLVTGTWYLIEGYYNPLTNQIGVAVSGGPWVVASHSGGMFDGSDSLPFSLNRMNLPGNAYGTAVNGTFDQLAIWRKAPTQALRDYVLNEGAGRSYDPSGLLPQPVAISAYEAETTTLLAALTGTYSDTRKGQINSLIKALKTANILARLDQLWVIGLNLADSLLNWKNPGTLNLSVVGAPVFTADRAFATSSAGWLNTNYNIATSGGNHGTASNAMGVYSRTNSTQDGVDMGAYGDGPNNHLFYSRTATYFSGSAVIFRPNQDITGESGFPNAVSSSRLLLMSRLDSACSYYRDGALISSRSRNPIALSNFASSILIGAANSQAGTAVEFSNRAYSAGLIGSGLTATDVAQFNTALATYLGRIGASV